MTIAAILVIGAGGIGLKHIDVLSSLEGYQIKCFDLNGDTLDIVKQRYPQIDVYKSLEQLDCQHLTGAIIATPTDTHIEYANWCVDMRIPFLVEKPLSSSINGVEELMKRCISVNLVCGIAFPRRSGDPYQTIKRKLDQGMLGELKLIRSNFSQNFRKYRPDYSRTYYSKYQSGGGIIMDALSHHVNLHAYYAGEIIGVSAIGERLVLENIEVEDSAFISMKFRGGVIGNIAGNQFQKPNEDFIELVGTNGNMRYERLSGVLEWNTSDEVAWHREYVSGDWYLILKSQIMNFLSAIKSNANCNTSVEEGVNQLKVILAARESMRTGRFTQIE